MKFVAFGELLLRLDTKGFERFVQAGEFTARFTGGEANVAAALALWGHRAAAVSKVPAHEIGQACVNYLRRYGVNTDWVARGGERLGILFVETGASQRPTKVLYDRGHSSFREIRPGDFDWETILAGADWLHFTGTAPALGPGVLAALEEAIQAAKRAGAAVSFDCNYRSTLWSVQEARSVLPRLVEQVDLFVGTSHDAAALFDIDDSPAQSASRLREKFGLKRVAYTLRQTPSASLNRLAGLVCDPAGCWTSREYEMQLVDRIGGGDTFSAGILHGIASGWDGQRTVEFAAAASCLKHSVPGDFGLVSLEEALELVDSKEAGRVRR
jgi:2-dehydro-3-deoxygluconokinase